MTLRIHNIRDHLIQMPKDKHSQRAIRLLINKRNNLLQYLKRVSVERYTAALSALGLESRAVEGEFVYTQEQMRGLRALQV
jgi:small subunit ribosomal protein S15